MYKNLMALLLADAGLNALVDGRIFWGATQPREVFPYIILKKVSEQRRYHFSAETRFVEARVQFDVWGQSNAQIQEIATALRALLSAKKIAEIQGIFFENSTDFVDRDDGGELIFRTSIDFNIIYGD